MYSENLGCIWMVEYEVKFLGKHNNRVLSFMNEGMSRAADYYQLIGKISHPRRCNNYVKCQTKYRLVS
jgi:hypothetical protein